MVKLLEAAFTCLLPVGQFSCEPICALLLSQK